MAEHWVISHEDAGTRLDVFLSKTIDPLTRSQAKKSIEAGIYSVNGTHAAAHYLLKSGDVIAYDGEKKILREEADEDSRTLRVAADDLRIIDETDAYIVLDKQAGVLMHPDHHHPHDHPSGTLIDAVIEHAPEIVKVGDDPVRPGIMSRLDKDVSGLVVIAKTQGAYEALKKQFAEHSVTKEYLALVHGAVEQDDADLKFRVARSSSKARMAALPEGSAEGQAAWTHVRVIERYAGATLVKLQILSGRTHQIRVHCFAFNHPVIGDILYKPRRAQRNIKAPRLMLQSIRLAFNDPETGERKQYALEPDPAFDAVISSLRNKKP